MVSNENSQRRLETSVKNNVTNPTENVKQKQFEIINEINPAPNKKDRGRSPVFPRDDEGIVPYGLHKTL